MNRRVITLKELASEIGVSQYTVRRRMGSWGLLKCSSMASRRPLLFFREMASEQLIKIRVISRPL